MNGSWPKNSICVFLRSILKLWLNFSKYYLQNTINRSQFFTWRGFGLEFEGNLEIWRTLKLYLMFNANNHHKLSSSHNSHYLTTTARLLSSNHDHPIIYIWLLSLDHHYPFIFVWPSLFDCYLMTFIAQVSSPIHYHQLTPSNCCTFCILSFSQKYKLILQYTL